jgi:hypothetical protein
MSYIVIVRTDRNGTEKGRYVLATRTVFPDTNSASVHAKGIDRSRKARIITGTWDFLREDPTIDLGYVVIARHRRARRKKGHYVLTSTTVHRSRREALLAAGILSPKTEPLVIPGNWNELRFGTTEFLLAT